MSFGSNLERLRKNHKLSQAKLGNALGITQQMISSYEKNISSPNMESLIKLSDFFKVSIDDLVDHKIEAAETDASVSQLKHLINTFTKEDIDRCLMILNAILIEREEYENYKKFNRSNQTKVNLA